MCRYLMLLALILCGPAFGEVIDLTSPQQVKQELARPGFRVLLYYSDGCGACQQFKPDYELLSQSFPDVHFYTLNVDKAVLAEHKKAKNFTYIPFLFAGHSEQELRHSPCMEPDHMVHDLKNAKRFVKLCIERK